MEYTEQDAKTLSIALFNMWTILKRKEADSALVLADARLVSILSSSTLGVLAYNYVPETRDLIFDYANPSADNILGVKNNDNIGKTIEESYPSLAGTEVPERYREIVEKDVTWDGTVAYRDEDIKGVFEVHAFKTGPNAMAAMFREVGEEQLLKKKVEDLTGKLGDAERECRMLADYLTTDKKKE